MSLDVRSPVAFGHVAQAYIVGHPNPLVVTFRDSAGAQWPILDVQPIGGRHLVTIQGDLRMAVGVGILDVDGTEYDWNVSDAIAPMQFVEAQLPMNSFYEVMVQP